MYYTVHTGYNWENVSFSENRLSILEPLERERDSLQSGSYGILLGICPSQKGDLAYHYSKSMLYKVTDVPLLCKSKQK